MQSQIALLRARRVPRSDGSTGRARRGWAVRSWRTLAAGLVLALVTGSGLAVASVSTAQAHDASYTTTCLGVTVKAWAYEGAGKKPGERNTITFQVDGQPMETVEFDGSKTHFFAFPTSTEVHTYSVTVNAWNDPTHKTWNKKWLNLTSTPCAQPGILTLDAAQCDVPGQVVDLSATFEKLVAGRDYELTLDSSAPSRSTVTYTPTQTKGSYTWPGASPGLGYTVTITDTTNRDLTASKSVTLIGCPDESGIAITATECTAPGSNASFAVTASALVTGREYRIDVYNANTSAVVGSHTFTATGALETHSYAATPSASYYATVVDTREAGGTPITSGTHTFLPCPATPGGPTLTVTECTALPVDPSVAGGAISVAVTGLVPGRSYDIVVTDAASRVVLNVQDHLAVKDTYDADLTSLPSGTYTATVTDVLLPTFTNTGSATLLPCPTLGTTIDLSANQCTAPGGKAEITATVSGFAIGRSYTVTLAESGIAIDTRALDSSTGAPQAIVYTALDPGKTYRVIVTDDNAVPAVNAAADISVAACPGDPDIAISQTECSVLGASTIQADFGKLVIGETYDVTVETTSDGKPVSGVAAQQIVATLPTMSLSFTDVPNGVDYTITIENAARTLTAVGAIFLEICDLPTFPLPPEFPGFPAFPELPTLALTGTGTLPATLAGLGILQLGLVLLGVALIRRRAVAREA